MGEVGVTLPGILGAAAVEVGASPIGSIVCVLLGAPLVMGELDGTVLGVGVMFGVGGAVGSGVGAGGTG